MRKTTIPKHHLISSSICDATAIAPVSKIIDEKYKIKIGYVTTLHPWLSYQNLMDGPSSSLVCSVRYIIITPSVDLR